MKRPLMCCYISGRPERNALFIVGFLISLQCVASATNHLLPFTYSFDRELRPLLEKRLFVTPADHGRMVELPAGPQPGESSIAVYCVSSANRCYVTRTAAAQNMDYVFAENRRDPLAAVRRVRIHRNDAEIPRSTASVIQAAWRRMLTATRPIGSYARPRLHAERIEFALVETSGKLVAAELPDNPGRKVIALVSLGRRVGDYAVAAEAERPRLLDEINVRAQELAR